MKHKISRILCTALCCAPLLASAQTSEKSTSPKRLYQEGQTLFQQKAYAAAISPLQAYVRQMNADGKPLPDTGERQEAEYMLVCAAYELRDPKSIDLLRAFLDEYPDTPHANRIYALIASSYFFEGNYDDALAMFNSARLDLLGTEERDDTPKGVLVRGMDELDGAFAEVGFPCVLKSQVLSGGRGKAGLIKVVKDAESAKATAKTLFESEHNVRMLLVEEAVDIDREIYLSITVDPVESKIMLIGCAEGGVEIEKLAATDPDKIVTVRVDIAEGLGGYHVNNLTYGMGLSGDLGKQVGAVVRGLYKTFRAYDAQLAEINPLFITKDGKAIAGDGKLIIDDNSVWRQPSYPLTRDYFDSEVEFEAAQEGIPYLQFNGDIALMCAGAGLTTTVFDLINDAGGHPATYVEFGGANYTKAVRTMELCLKTPSKVILVVTFGTIARADVMAQGLVEAIKAHQPKQPIVTCIRGTNEEEAFAILRDAGLEPLTNTEEAVQRAVDIAAGRA